MTEKALIALTAAVALGALSAGSAAMAANENDGGYDSGGYVLPGSIDGVNPVYHPDIFGSPAAAEAYGFVPPVRRPSRPQYHR